jgi:hypothetical protein
MKINFLLFFIPYILHVITTYYQINRAQDNKYIDINPLRDIIHDHSINLTDLKYRHLDNLFIIFLIPYLQKGNLEAITLFFKVLSIIVLIRTISSSITDLPSSNSNCKFYTNFNSIYSYTLGHCFDKIFSGHTAATLLLILCANQFNLISDSNLIYWILIQIIYVYIGLICTRHHYSVDVFLSYIITPLIYNSIKNYI